MHPALVGAPLMHHLKTQSRKLVKNTIIQYSLRCKNGFRCLTMAEFCGFPSLARLLQSLWCSRDRPRTTTERLNNDRFQSSLQPPLCSRSITRHLGSFHGHCNRSCNARRPDRLIEPTFNPTQKESIMFDLGDMSSRVVAAVSSLAISAVLFAYAIVPAEQGVAVVGVMA